MHPNEQKALDGASVDQTWVDTISEGKDIDGNPEPIGKPSTAPPNYWRPHPDLMAHCALERFTRFMENMP